MIPNFRPKTLYITYELNFKLKNLSHHQQMYIKQILKLKKILISKKDFELLIEI